MAGDEGAAGEIFRTKTRDEWCDIMEHTDVCFAPVLTMGEAAAHPHNKARDTFVEVDGMVQPAPAPRFSRTTGRDPAARRPIPGQHTDEVLADWGVAAADVDKLVETGAVKQADGDPRLLPRPSRRRVDRHRRHHGRAAAAGHRVVLVVATGGRVRRGPRRPRAGRDAVGSAPGGDGGRRRSSASAGSSGSATWTPGMTGWEQNGDPASFLQADVDEAAERLAAVLREERADVVTVYDWHGNYGHPDHIRVHGVGHRAAELAGTPERVRIDVQPRRHVRGSRRRASGGRWATGPRRETDDGRPFGMAEAEITTAVDVGDFVERKRASVPATPAR